MSASAEAGEIDEVICSGELMDHLSSLDLSDGSLIEALQLFVEVIDDRSSQTLLLHQPFKTTKCD
jgi:hypothetical protein